MINVAQNIERGRLFFPDKTALIFEEISYSYQELDRLVNRAANVLRGLGIEKGDRVALFLPNIPEFVMGYLGIQKIGAVAVSINAMLKSDEVKFILNDCMAKVIVTTEKLLPQVPADDLAYLEGILIAEGQANQGMSLAAAMKIVSDEARSLPMAPTDPAAILYTSGTTGFPKGAMLSHGNVISNMHSGKHTCSMKPEDRLLLYLPLFHCFGQNFILNTGLNACATIVLQRRFELEKVLEAIASEKITVFFGVPAVFARLLEKHPEREVFQNVRYYFSAAALMPTEIVQRWRSLYGKLIHEGYGLTETSPSACYNHDLRYKEGSIGMPIENVQMKVVDEDGEEVPVGEIGEIVVRGPNVMLGYWNRPEETAKVLKDGWFHTGDLGSMDEDGYFYLVDRLKDMINVCGFKVYPAEVERVLYQHPAIAEAAVYGVSDPVKGEIVKANIRLKSSASGVALKVSDRDIIDFCSQKMAVYKVPQVVQFVDSFPKNATGKVLKRILRESHTQPSQQLV